MGLLPWVNVAPRTEQFDLVLGSLSMLIRVLAELGQTIEGRTASRASAI